MIDVTCAIIIRDNKILATQRSEKMSLPLKWEFPGGKVENNETEEDCILREIVEELSIRIEILKKMEPQRYKYKELTINLIPFVSNYISGEIELTEHKDYKWVALNELNLLDWADADILVIENFLKLDYDTTRTL
jgi:8-oxo-dGTP diphosphatase